MIQRMWQNNQTTWLPADEPTPEVAAEVQEYREMFTEEELEVMPHHTD